MADMVQSYMGEIRIVILVFVGVSLFCAVYIATVWSWAKRQLKSEDYSRPISLLRGVQEVTVSLDEDGKSLTVTYRRRNTDSVKGVVEKQAKQDEHQNHD